MSMHTYIQSDYLRIDSAGGFLALRLAVIDVSMSASSHIPTYLHTSSSILIRILLEGMVGPKGSQWLKSPPWKIAYLYDRTALIGTETVCDKECISHDEEEMNLVSLTTNRMMMIRLQ